MRSFSAFMLVIGLFSFGLEQAVAETKIGVVSRTITQDLPQLKQMYKKIEKEFEPRKNKIVADQENAKKLEDKYNRDGPTMSDAQRNALKNRIIQKKRSIKRATEEFREDIKYRESEEQAKLQKQVYKVIKEIAKSENFDLVLMDGVVVLHHSSKVDISKKVIAQMKKL